MAQPAINSDPILLPGLSGNSWLHHAEQVRQVIRYQPINTPYVNRQREFRILHKLAASQLAVPPLSLDHGQLTVAWLAGTPLDAEQFHPTNPQLMTLITSLHHQPRFGYPLSLSKLVARYWQLCRQRNPLWLKQLQRLRRKGEPRPLRLVPLHMDIHPGNIIQTEQGLRLIDWEYAADGCLAVELATLCQQYPQDAAEWQRLYSAKMQLPLALVSRQVARWLPWVQLLQASWYQLKAEQTGQPHFSTLANAYWHQL